MPRLLLFAPCEKVITDQQGNSVSLITLLQEIRYSVFQNVQIPPNAALPMKWDVLSLWEKETGDEGIEFEQKIRLVDRNERVLIEYGAQFRFEKRVHRLTLRILGFPMTEPGLLNLVLLLTRPGLDWTEVTRYPLELVRETTAQ
jgi:hypothetical protein